MSDKIKPSEVSEVLQQQLQEVNGSQQFDEVGTVLTVSDGVARIYGLRNAEANELLEFENGTMAIVMNLEEDNVGCVLLGPTAGIKEGQSVKRTHRIASIRVNDNFLGRVVNPLGQAIDGLGDIDLTDSFEMPLDRKAPGVIYRQPVKEPLQTGLKAVDSMIPIGRGQRELIIGDRQTGKTSIATDAILNQKGKDVICVYVAIGQKASTIAKLTRTLEAHDAMSYTIVVAATASDPASLQYVAPYAGTSLAEYFMYKGKDVLIVYDDLSKHAVAYRALSLLLERSPGREAYPGDVFYLHSRLLERSARLTEEAGGGSITALPIIETQAGDLSAYIPTNVISITDGQIFLESSLFFSGQRPAVNVGLSVSRVGGAAQTKAMKKAAGSIRIDLAQFREMEVFTQFSSDLDESTKQQLAYGNGLMEILKQPLGRPLSMAEQVITLYAATHKKFMDIPKDKVKKFQMKMLDDIRAAHADIYRELEEGKVLTDELGERILAAVEEVKSSTAQ